MRPKVYLAGPISGLSYGEAQEWRSYATGILAHAGINGFSPLRQKHFLRIAGKLDATISHQQPLATDRGIMTRDHYDVMTCDVLLVNFIGATVASRGTDMELAWAYAYRKPVVVATDPDSTLLAHPMIAEAVDYAVWTLDEALDVVRAILTPDALA